MSLPLALQMFTVRDHTAQDFSATLQQIREIGYTHVELAGLAGYSATEAADFLKDAGLSAVGTHNPPDQLADEINEIIEGAEALGCEYVTCPFLAPPWRNPDGFRQAAELLNTAGATLKQAGIQLSYHNHAFEFDTLEDGTTGMDILLERTDADIVTFEVDLGWLKVAGKDPLDFTRALSGRVPLLHVKDMARLDPVVMAEVGTGLLEFKPIIDEAPQWGTRFFIIEQDKDWVDHDPMKSATISYQNLQKMLG